MIYLVHPVQLKMKTSRAHIENLRDTTCILVYVSTKLDLMPVPLRTWLMMTEPLTNKQTRDEK